MAAAAVAGVLAGALGACGSEEDKTPGKKSSRKKASSAPAPPSRAQLKKMLLAKSDLPKSLKQYDKVFPVPIVKGNLEASKPRCQPLADALHRGMPDQTHAWAKQRYMKALRDRFTVSLASYPSEKEAAAAVGELKTSAAACTSPFRMVNKKAHYTDPYQGVKNKTAPRQGDQALAYDLRAVADDGSRREFPFLHIYVRVGNVVATFVRVGSDRPEDNVIPPDLVEAQVGKLKSS
ncbi:hypothetical protein ITI46_01210 [Streptomyces oryzae]|uniref:Lipoprotein n=1 Tax=Streptomyces oryzae TaxID=1434886 RepID=A0ABS3X4N5_9ACTN|nr:hypothetical protein [Streptomyces oryzae]MBO8190340.1 hypothetical protein [Streptomyces oryzae]